MCELVLLNATCTRYCERSDTKTLQQVTDYRTLSQQGLTRHCSTNIVHVARRYPTVSRPNTSQPAHILETSNRVN